MNITFILVLLALTVSGCASLQDAPKKMAGVSRRSLEAAKADSIYQVYTCDMAACFDAVVDIAAQEKYTIFMKDPVQGFISLMNIPGVVNTTEVGVFMTQLSHGQGVRVELSSRSSPAKKVVAKKLFSELGNQFKK